MLPGVVSVKKNRERFPGLVVTSPSRILLPFLSTPWIGTFNHITFPTKCRSTKSANVLCWLGSSNPCTKAVHMDHFSTAVFKFLVCIFATTTKICTNCGLTQTNVLSCHATISPSYTPSLLLSHKRAGIGCPLQRNPFSGLVHSAGELLHIPKRVSTSMTTVLLSK